MRMTQYPSGANDNKEISHEEYLQCNKPLIDDEIKIEVYKGARTFGLVLVGGVNNQQSPGDCGIYVSKVQEGGLAGVDGRIIPGDRIMAIKQYLEDGDAYTFCFDQGGNVTHEDAKQLLRRCKGRVAIFIVRKNEQKQNSDTLFDKTSQKIIIEPTHEKQIEDRPALNKCGSQNNDQSESDYTNSDTSLKSYSYSSQNKITNISSRSSEDKLCKYNKSSIQLIKLTTLKGPKSWFNSTSQNSVQSSLDYRDMAKYGLRQTSLLSGNVINSINSNVRVQRTKTNGASSSISSLSIQEEDEEELYSSSLPPLQKGFEHEIEQRVL